MSKGPKASSGSKDKVSNGAKGGESTPLLCGLVMPISALEGCPEGHWVEVRGIITDAIASIKDPCFDVTMVNEASDAGVIHKRIVQNIYNADIIVVDVSGRNPNVMFELGMCAAFDKRVVIVKDEQTPYSFDTQSIEHILYPRDLRFSQIVKFKDVLANKVASTHKGNVGASGSSFLASFGPYNVPKLEQTEVSTDRFVVEALEDLRREMRGFARRLDTVAPREPAPPSGNISTLLITLMRSRLRQYIVDFAKSEDISDLTAMIEREDFIKGARDLADPHRLLSDEDFQIGCRYAIQPFRGAAFKSSGDPYAF